MPEPKFNFPDPVWVEARKDEEWFIKFPESDYVLTTYGDNSWHVALRGAMTGRMIDHEDDVHTLEDAKTYVYRATCDRIKSLYLKSLGNVKRIECCYMDNSSNKG